MELRVPPVSPYHTPTLFNTVLYLSPFTLAKVFPLWFLLHVYLRGDFTLGSLESVAFSYSFSSALALPLLYRLGAYLCIYDLYRL